MGVGKLTVLVGGQYGSEGKGAVAAFVADDYDVHVRVGSPNAGHTIYWNNKKHVMQSIPCGWINPYATIVIGRGALINMKLLMNEIVHILPYYPNFLSRLKIDAKAGVLAERFHEQEGGTHGEMHKRIGSTGEGVGPARVARINRDPEQFQLFEEVAEEYGLEKCVYDDTPSLIAQKQDEGANVLIEGTQGSGLSLIHSHWPYCTSIDTNAAGIISEVGIAPSRVTDVLMVCRTYPIRVHGNSGPMKNEISWDELNRRIGGGIKQEKTTVTKKVRRIAEWDDELFKKSCMLNNPTEIALMFADYVDKKVAHAMSRQAVLMSDKLVKFIAEHGLGDKLRYVGTGPDTMVDMKKEEEKEDVC